MVLNKGSFLLRFLNNPLYETNLYFNEKGEIFMSNELLDTEIKRLFRELESKTPGSKEYNDVQDCLNILYKLKLEEDKNHENAEIQRQKNGDDKEYQNRDIDLKEQQIQENKAFNWLRFGVDVAGIALPLIFCRKTWREGLKIEKLDQFIGSPSAKNALKFFTPWRKK